MAMDRVGSPERPGGDEASRALRRRPRALGFCAAALIINESIDYQLNG
jgi:hypothetical protein